LLNNLPVGVLIYKKEDLSFANLGSYKLLLGTHSNDMTQLSQALGSNEQLKGALSAPRPAQVSIQIEENKELLVDQQSSQVRYLDEAGNTKPLGVNTIVVGLHEESYKVCILQDNSLCEELEREKLGKQYMKNFFTMITHELRNPLHGVLGIFEALLEALNGKDLAVQCEMGVTTIKLMMRLINDMLDLAQFESNKFKLIIEEADIVELINECVELMQFKYRMKGISLVYKQLGRIPRVKCDKNRYMQILINLLGNAIKFTEQGEVTVRVSYDTTSNQIVTTVKDTGVGIKQESQSELFSLFGKLDGNAFMNPEGCGLGLHICKKLSEAMGGFVKLESAPLKGTAITFTIENKGDIEPSDLENQIQISLPTEKQSEADPNDCCDTPCPYTAPPGQTAGANIGKSFMHTKSGIPQIVERPVLIVDDEFICASAVQTYLRANGYEADIVSGVVLNGVGIFRGTSIRLGKKTGELEFAMLQTDLYGREHACKERD